LSRAPCARLATRANIQRTMTIKFLESIQPIVKQAVAQSISDMVATSLSTPEAMPLAAPVEVVADEDAPIVDPDNERIVTTIDEQNLHRICCDILPGEDLQARDTESYFSIMHAGKSNRWLFRFWGDKKRPAMQFIVPLTDTHRAEISRAGLQIGASDQVLLDKPENLYRLVGIVGDALAYCKDDENFRRKARGSEAQ